MSKLRWFVGLAAVGCGGILGIEKPESRPDAGTPESGRGGAMSGNGGDNATGGAGSGGSAGLNGKGGVGGKGGSSGRSGSGGDIAGGRTAGGDAGMSVGEVGGSGAEPPLSGGGGAGGDGQGGEGAEGGREYRGEIGEPCEAEGEIACLKEDGPTERRVICVDGEWSVYDPCDEPLSPGLYWCDRRTGACGYLAYGCPDIESGERGTCWSNPNILRVCGPDRVTIEEVECVFGCDAGDCIPPYGDQLVVDKPQTTTPPVEAYWPLGSLIPVCFEPSSNPEEWEIEVIRKEVDAYWTRYSSIDFTEFDLCAEDDTAAHVAVRFKESCDGELSGIEQVGYPGPEGTSRVFFCREYVDAGGATVAMDPELLRFVTRHQFGHVLGFEDDIERFITNYDDYGFMTRAVETTRIEELLGYPHPALMLSWYYGQKPRGSMVTPSGECVTRAGSAFTLEDCTGAPSQQFGFNGDTFGPRSSETECFRSGPGIATPISDCSATPGAPEQTFVVRNVEWRAAGWNCLAAERVGTSSTFDFKGRFCDRTNTAQQWDFHFLPQGRLRVENPATGRCLTRGYVGTVANPDLAPCDDSDRIQESFELTYEGQIHHGGLCIYVHQDGAATGGSVEFETCHNEAEMFFVLSGRITNPNYGALTLMPSTGNTYVFETWAASSDREQIFDLYF